MNTNSYIEKRRGRTRTNNRTMNSARNIGFGLANKVVSVILAFVSRTIFLRILSVDYLGINGLFSDILTMLSLADLGFGVAMAYSFYQPLAENNETKLAALMTFYKKIYVTIACAISVIGIALIPFLKYIINLEHEIPYLTVYYMLYLANTVFSYLFAYKSSILAADQKNYILSQYSAGIGIIRTVLQMIILYLTHNYICYLAVNIIATISGNLLVSRKAVTTYPYIKHKKELKRDEKRHIFQNLKSVFLYKLVSVAMAGTDNILISAIVGTTAVGMYSNYNTVITLQLGSLAAILFGSLTSSVGNLIITEKSEKRYEVFELMQLVSFLISGLFIVCLRFLTEDFITLWLGAEYVLSRGTLLVILLNFYITLTFQPLWSFREASGLYNQIKYVLLVTMALNISGSIILGRMFGVPGILGATFISKITTYFWYEPKVLFKKYFSRNVVGYYLKHLINVLMILLCIWIVDLIMPNMKEITILSWFIKAFLCGGVVAIIYGSYYGRTKEFRKIITKISAVFRS